MVLPDPVPQTSTPPVRPWLPRLVSWGVWFVVALLFYVATVQTGFDLDTIAQGFPYFFEFVVNDLWPPNWQRALPQLWQPLLETVQMAYLGTVFGVIIGMPLVFLASRNTTWHPLIMWLTRSFLTLIRSVPDLLYAAVLVGILAFGPLPGTVALTIFTVAILAKLTSEYVEAIDVGPLEALHACGATRLHVIVYGVMPQIAASLISFILYIFEINVRASTVLGLVGAGGLGTLVRIYTARFQYDRLSVLLIITFFLVIIIDSVSAYARSRLT